MDEVCDLNGTPIRVGHIVEVCGHKNEKWHVAQSEVSGFLHCVNTYRDLFVPIDKCATDVCVVEDTRRAVVNVKQEVIVFDKSQVDASTIDKSLVGAFSRCFVSHVTGIRSLSPHEAILAFVAWLTLREDSLTLGARHDRTEVARLVKDFCYVQGFDDPREGFESVIIEMPKPPGPSVKHISGPPRK